MNSELGGWVRTQLVTGHGRRHCPCWHNDGAGHYVYVHACPCMSMHVPHDIVCLCTPMIWTLTHKMLEFPSTVPEDRAIFHSSFYIPVANTELILNESQKQYQLIRSPELQPLIIFMPKYTLVHRYNQLTIKGIFQKGVLIGLHANMCTNNIIYLLIQCNIKYIRFLMKYSFQTTKV